MCSLQEILALLVELAEKNIEEDKTELRVAMRRRPLLMITERDEEFLRACRMRLDEL